MWDTGATGREAINQFLTEANRFTAKISETETTFLDTTVFKGERFSQDSIFDIHSTWKLQRHLQYKRLSSCHAPGEKKDLLREKHSGF